MKPRGTPSQHNETLAPARLPTLLSNPYYAGKIRHRELIYDGAHEPLVDEELGLENQLGALGLVLNCATLWTTRYLDAAVTQLRDQDYPIREEDLARLSPFVHSHLGVLGTYTFATPDLAPGTIRDLRDPDAPEDDET